MRYVLKYTEDGQFNRDCGWPVPLSEATIYESIEEATEAARTLDECTIVPLPTTPENGFSPMHTASDFTRPSSVTTIAETLLAQLTQAYALIDKLRDDEAQAHHSARLALDTARLRTREANALETVIYRARQALRDPLSDLSPEQRIAAALDVLDAAYRACNAPTPEPR